MTQRNAASEQFLQDGLFRYAEAHATVDEFERTAAKKVAAVAKLHAWRLGGRRARPENESSGFCDGDKGGRVAYAAFAGECGRRAVTWEFGIWWQLPPLGAQVVVYAEVVTGPAELKRATWAKRPSPVAGTWERYPGGIHLVLRKGDSLDDAFLRLVKEVAKQSAATARRRG
jgi:hypothetical protein